MRKLIVGLIAVGLLAVAAPAMAQTADPLGLIASGAVIPYVGSQGISVVSSTTGGFTGAQQNVGSLAILEVSSPVGSNAPPEESIFGSKPFHMFFFDQSCARVGPSVGAPLTNNDSELINLNLISGIPSTGLIAAAGVDNSGGVFDHLSPLSNPIHARVYWINAVDGVLSRVLEPISIHNPEALSLNGTWNPLRSGATFTAPLEGSGVSTTVYFLCPTRNIIAAFPEPVSETNGACALGNGNCFPRLRPRPVGTTSATPLFVRIYDDEEKFLRNVDILCRCWGAHPVLGIDPVYGNPDPVIGAPRGTYTEVEGEPGCTDADGGPAPCSFTGYRSIRWGAGVVGNDVFGRLSNGSIGFLRGFPPVNIGFPIPVIGGNIIR
jgi:hypothetical protein